MEKKKTNLKRIIYFSAFVLLTLLEVYIAIYVHDTFIRPYLGDVLVVMVVYFFVGAIRPEGFKLLPLYVFLFAVCVEVSQYFHLVRLLGMEDNRVISTILGGVFDWMDIICYGIGCAIIWIVSLVINNANKRNNILKKRIISSIILIVITAAAIGSIFILKEENGESYVLQLDGTLISPEIYNAYLIQKTILASDKFMDSSANLMEQEIDGTPIPDWIKAEVEGQIIYDYVMKIEWDKQGVTVNQSEQDRLNTYLEQQWEINKEVFEGNQCDRDAFNAAYQSFLYNDLVFEAYLTQKPTEETEISSSVEIASAKYFIINKYSLEGKKYTEEETDTLITLVEDYIKELKSEKSLDEIYKNYLIKTSEDTSTYHPISTSIISSDNTEYTSKVPNFVNALMKAQIDIPFYTEDEYYITIGIRQEDENRQIVQEAYADNAVKKIQKEKFEESIEDIIKSVNVKRNAYIIKKYSPTTIKLSELKEGEI